MYEYEYAESIEYNRHDNEYAESTEICITKRMQNVEYNMHEYEYAESTV